ncbi:MAG TPA: LCP family protein, partial [Candidatus Saccharimonadales bacterium]|nr:LCP family protein [Candidatus Saccharimonadales bacterium]
MFKNRKARPLKPPIETGKTLPNRVSSYSPGPPAAPRGRLAVEPKRRLWPKLLAIFGLTILASAIALVVFLAIWDVHNISKASQKLFGNGSIVTLLKGGNLPTDSSGRVNVLIAGYSADDPGHAGANLTDSIILLSLSPANKTGYMLSIPRDLYVNVPGFGYSKINAVYEDGGMSLLEKVVGQTFNVQISHYALIDYAATRSLVDALGGITIDVNSPDGRLYDPSKDYSTGGPLVDLTNGQHTLNGQQALDFSRARGDDPNSIGFEQSDFQRTADQRQVFSAIKAKLNWKLVLNPRQNSQILNAVADNVKTDLPAGQARPLFGLFNSIPNSKLKSISLRDLNGTNYLTGYTTYYG